MTKKVITTKDMLKYETVSQMKADLDNLTGTLRHLNDEDPKIFQDDFYGPYMQDLEDISNNHLGIDLENIYNEIDRLTKLVESLQQSTGQPIIEEQKITIDALTKEKFRLMDRNCELFQLNTALKRNAETLKGINAKKDEKINKLEASLKSEEEWSKKLWDENEVRQVGLLDAAPPNLKKLCDSFIDIILKYNVNIDDIPVVSITRGAVKEYNELEAKYQSACGQISEYEEENRKLKEKLEEISKLVKTAIDPKKHLFDPQGL